MPKMSQTAPMMRGLARLRGGVGCEARSGDGGAEEYSAVFGGRFIG